MREDLWVGAGEDGDDDDECGCKDWNGGKHIHFSCLVIIGYQQIFLQIVEEDEEQASWVYELDAYSEVGFEGQHPERALSVGVGQ